MGCLKLHAGENYTTLKVVYSVESTRVLGEQAEKNSSVFLEVGYKDAQGNGGDGFMSTVSKYNEPAEAAITLTQGNIYGAQKLANAVSKVKNEIQYVKFLKVIGNVTGAISVIDNYNKFFDNPSENWWDGVKATGQAGFMLFGGEEAELLYNLTVMGIDGSIDLYGHYNHPH